MPYSIATPIPGQPISAGAFGVPVKTAITDLDLRIAAQETGSQAFIARARRTTNATGIVAEVGVLRLDNVPVRAGKIYQIQTGSLNLDGSVANDIAMARFRLAFNAAPGTVATTASTQVGIYRMLQDDVSNSSVSTMNGFYLPVADGYISILLSVQRIGGTGSIIAIAAPTEPMDFVVQFGGNDPGDTGVVL